MARKEKLFKSTEYKSREEASQFLRELADKIAAGSVSMVQGGQEVSFEIPRELKLEVEAEQKDKGQKGLRQEIELELSWYEGDQPGSLELK